nr:ADP-ribosylation factor-like protein [Candidatus Sigynarchaeota archaeon]
MPPEDQQKKPKKKIVLIGLDNAGKSSIVDIVIKKVVSPIAKEPTRGAERSDLTILGQDIIIHDLGGQKRYRKQYLDNESYLASTDALILVIDLQDASRYDSALEYFDDALGAIEKIGLHPPVFCLLHKFDGYYVNDYKDVSVRTRLEFDQLSDEVKKIALKHKMGVPVNYTTSIHDAWVLQETFFKIWGVIVPRLSTMDNFLSELVEKNPSIGVALMLDNKRNVIAKRLIPLEGVNVEDIAASAMKMTLTLLDWQDTLKSRKMEEDNPFAIIQVEKESVMIQRLFTSVETLFLLIYAAGEEYLELQTRLAKISFILEGLLQ